MNQACAHCSPNAFIYSINEHRKGNIDFKYNHKLIRISNNTYILQDFFIMIR